MSSRYIIWDKSLCPLKQEGKIPKVLIFYIGPKMRSLLAGFGDAFRYEDYEVTEMTYFLTDYSSENNSEMLVKLLTGKLKNKFDLVVLFDEYEDILKEIKDLIPTKIPVIYVDIFSEVEEVDGLIWFGGMTLPSDIIEKADEKCRK